MKKIKILIVDDSAIYRSQVKRAIESEEKLEVVATAKDGVEAIELAEKKQPDLIILDMEMPNMDGIETLKSLKQKDFKGEVIVFASPTAKSAERTLEALSLGACDFIPKPTSIDSTDANISPSVRIRNALIPKVQGLLSKVGVRTLKPRRSEGGGKYSPVNWDLFQPKVLVIGSSTGGPTALESLFKMLTPPFSVPVVITQHMPPVFTATFAERLGKVCGMPSMEASNGMWLQANHIYVAKGGLHLRLKRNRSQVETELFDGPDINFIKPAVDPMFESAAKIYGPHCLGVVLTGMGRDGCDGAKEIKQNQGCIFIQDKESCAVWGMPAAVFNEGCFDKELSLEQIAQKINSKVSLKASKVTRGAS